MRQAEQRNGHPPGDISIVESSGDPVLCVPYELSASSGKRPIVDLGIDWERFVTSPRPVETLVIDWEGWPADGR